MSSSTLKQNIILLTLDRSIKITSRASDYSVLPPGRYRGPAAFFDFLLRLVVLRFESTVADAARERPEPALNFRLPLPLRLQLLLRTLLRLGFFAGLRLRARRRLLICVPET